MVGTKGIYNGLENLRHPPVDSTSSLKAHSVPVPYVVPSLLDTYLVSAPPLFRPPYNLPIIPTFPLKAPSRNAAGHARRTLFPFDFLEICVRRAHEGLPQIVEAVLDMGWIAVVVEIRGAMRVRYLAAMGEQLIVCKPDTAQAM